MHSITLRELRDTKQIKTWLRAGEHIEVRERGEIIGDLVPRTPPRTPAEWPDFEARLRKQFGDRVLPGADLLISSREDERY